jgi:hypothetical protein
MRILILIILIVWLLSDSAYTRSQTLVPDLTVRRELNLPTNIFKTVLVTGYGDSPALARQDAFKLAVEQAAGIVVASETQTSRQQIVRDQVATYSQARISNFAIVTMEKTNGIWTCLVWVTVRSACTNDTYNCVN